jgi:carbamoyltransferase
MVALDPLFPEIRLSRPPRDESTKLPDDYYSSVAYAVQHVLERVAMQGARLLCDATQSPNICIAGGCGLNIDANTKFLTEAGFKHIFIQPGASDTGIPLGCVLFGYHMILGLPRFWTMKSASLGRRYDESEIRSALEKHKDQLTVTKSKNISAETAKLIADGNIIGWFQGGGEYGPRALGNRSILCNAAVKDMKDVLNNRVKHRESWRPFAAAILRERMHEYFELEEESPFMLLVAPVKKEKQSEVPSIVHIDGTCRVQSVTREANGRYYDLIQEFANITGIPLILNTSFNLGGDPIVETPDDTIRCFLATHMDYLVLEDYLIQKRQPTEINKSEK